MLHEGGEGGDCVRDFKACSIDGCHGNAHISANGATGLCCAHYKRKRKTGDPLGSQKKDGPALSWIKEHASFDLDECLLWPFSRQRQGYGCARYAGRGQLAHRVMCIIAHGDPQHPDMDAAHTCGKGHEGCVNPKHLRWATRSANLADKVAHGTSNRGMNNPLAKLTEEDVRRIREMRGALPQDEIALMFGIDQSNVSKIQTGHSWFWM